MGLRPNEGSLQEPETEFVKSQYGRSIAKTIRQNKECLVKMGQVLDPSTIKHAEDCNCVGCIIRRDALSSGQIPETPITQAQLQSLVASLEVLKNDGGSKDDDEKPKEPEDHGIEAGAEEADTEEIVQIEEDAEGDAQE